MNYFTFPGIPRNSLDTFASVFRAIREEFQVTETELAGKSRKRELVILRQLFCYILCLRSDHSLAEIGKQINRDHTTVIHSRDTIKDLLDVNDPKVSSAWKRLTSKL